MRKYIILLLAALINFSTDLHAQLDRSKQPRPGPAPEIQLSDYDKFELPNGLKVFVVENHQLPTVSFSLILDIDPIMENEAAGYIDMAGELIRTATTTRTKDQLDEEIDFIGATLNTSAASVYASSLKKHVNKLVELMSDVVIHPVFKQEELEKLKTKTLSNLAAAKDEPGTIADRLVKVLYYGRNHPYSEFETENTVNNISLDLCRDYYDSYFKPNIAYLAVVGDITRKEAEPLIKKYFGEWKRADVKNSSFAQPEAPPAARVAVVDRPAAVQSTIRIGHPVDLKVGSPEVIKANVANTILGGGVFRLFKNLREKHAYTYGAYSSLSPDKVVGNFTATTEVKNAVTDSAISEILYEMKRIRNERPDETELTLAKNYTSGNFALALERPETIARFAINIERYNLPKDYYANYLKNVAAVSSDEVMLMANKYIRPDNSYIIVVGNAAEVSDKLKGFSSSGQIEFYDIYGRKYDPAASAPPAGLNAQSIIDNYIDVLGGRDKMLKVNDRTTEMSGTVGMSGTNPDIKINISVFQKQPGKLYQETKVNGKVQQEIIFDGEKAIQISPTGRQEITGEQLEELKMEADLYSVLDRDKYGIKTKLAAIEKIDGKDAYKLEMTAPTGNKWYEYYDKNTGLKLRQIKTISSPMGQITQTTDFGDYREVNGVKYPFKLSQSVGQQKIDLSVSSIRVNTKLNDDMFDPDKK